MPVKEKFIKAWRLFRMLQLWKKVVLIFIFIIMLHWLYIVLLIFVNPPITTTQIKSLLDGYGIKRDYVSYNQISYQAGLAVIGAEDQIFAEHFGLDYESIEKAIEFNKKHTKRKRGASTISQQVAKNVFLWQGRSWIRKGLEVYFTFMIELIWSKKRILDIYLNSVEMGKGIFGIQAASKFFFNKNASQLSRQEAATIAACLPNPKRFRPNAPSPYILSRRDWIIEQMYQIEFEPEIIELVRKMKH